MVRSVLRTMRLALVGIVFGFPGLAHGQDNAQTLTEICEAVEQNFHDPTFNGVDWTEECAKAAEGIDTLAPDAFEARMAALLATLDTSHTAYIPHNSWRMAALAQIFGLSDEVEALTRQHGGAPKLRGSGYFTADTEGAVFVDVVLDGSPAARAGLRAGDEILDSDGSEFVTVWPNRPATQPAAQANVRIRRERKGPTISLTMDVREQDALTWLVDATDASVRVIDAEGLRIGYLRGWTMMTRPEIGGPADTLVRAMQDGSFDAVDAVILDARGMIGGGGTDMLGRWMEPRIPMRLRSRDTPGWIDVGGLPYDTPLVLLIGGHTRSGAEIFAKTVQYHELAPLVGSQSAGALTAGRYFALPNGAGLYVAVALLEVAGDIVEGQGVTPDVPVDRPIPYAGGADPQFEAAVAEAVRLARELEQR